MAIRIDRDLETLYIYEAEGDAMPDPEGPWTLLGHLRVETTVADNSPLVVWYGNEPGTVYHGIYTGAAGDVAYLLGNNGSGETGAASTYSMPPGDYHVALRYDGVGTLTAVFTTAAGVTTVLTLSMTVSGHVAGHNSITWAAFGLVAGWIDSTWERWRMWAAHLSLAEIEAERRSLTPVRTSGLMSNWPMAPGATRFADTLGSATLKDNPDFPTNDDGQAIRQVLVDPISQTRTVGQTMTVSITGTGQGTLIYQWQRNTGSGWSNISGATSASYTTPTLAEADDGNQYRCGLSDANGTTYSQAATVTGLSVAKITYRDSTAAADSSFGVTQITAAAPTMVDGDEDVIIATMGTIAPANPPLHATPAGFDPVGVSDIYDFGGGALRMRMQAFRRRATGPGSGAVLNPGAVGAMGYVRASFSNPKGAGAVVRAVFNHAAAGTTLTIPGITTTANNALLMAMISQAAAQTITPPGSMTEREDISSAGISMATELQAVAGASGNKVFTLPSAADATWALLELHSVEAESPSYADADLGASGSVVSTIRAAIIKVASAVAAGLGAFAPASAKVAASTAAAVGQGAFGAAGRGVATAVSAMPGASSATVRGAQVKPSTTAAAAGAVAALQAAGLASSSAIVAGSSSAEISAAAIARAALAAQGSASASLDSVLVAGSSADLIGAGGGAATLYAAWLAQTLLAGAGSAATDFEGALIADAMADLIVEAASSADLRAVRIAPAQFAGGGQAIVFAPAARLVPSSVQAVGQSVVAVQAAVVVQARAQASGSSTLTPLATALRDARMQAVAVAALQLMANSYRQGAMAAAGQASSSLLGGRTVGSLLQAAGAPTLTLLTGALKDAGFVLAGAGQAAFAVDRLSEAVMQSAGGAGPAQFVGELLSQASLQTGGSAQLVAHASAIAHVVLSAEGGSSVFAGGLALRDYIQLTEGDMTRPAEDRGMSRPADGAAMHRPAEAGMTRPIEQRAMEAKK